MLHDRAVRQVCLAAAVHPVETGRTTGGMVTKRNVVRGLHWDEVIARGEVVGILEVQTEVMEMTGMKTTKNVEVLVADEVDVVMVGDEAEAVHQRVRAVELDRAPLPQLSPGAWQMYERGIEVAAVRVWNEVKAQAREVARIAQDLAGKARDWLERSVEQVRDAVERPASSDPWGDFFAQAAADGVSDGLSRDLKAEQRHSETRQQAEHELELQRKERNGHALRDRSDDYELGY